MPKASSSVRLMWPKLAKMWWNFNYWTLIKSWLKSTLLIEEVNQSNWKYRKLARVWSYMMTLPFLNPATSRQKAIFFVIFFLGVMCFNTLRQIVKKKTPRKLLEGHKNMTTYWTNPPIFLPLLKFFAQFALKYWNSSSSKRKFVKNYRFLFQSHRSGPLKASWHLSSICCKLFGFARIVFVPTPHLRL